MLSRTLLLKVQSFVDSWSGLGRGLVGLLRGFTYKCKSGIAPILHLCVRSKSVIHRFYTYIWTGSRAVCGVEDVVDAEVAVREAGDGPPPGLKGSIAEGPNHSNFSAQNSVHNSARI